MSRRRRSSRRRMRVRARPRTTRSSGRCSSVCWCRPPSRAAVSTGTTTRSSAPMRELETSLFGERRRYSAVAPARRALAPEAGRARPGRPPAPVRRCRALDALARVARAASRRLRARARPVTRPRAPRGARRRRRAARRPVGDRRRGERASADDVGGARCRPGPLRDARRAPVRDPPRAPDRGDAATRRAVATRRLPHADRRRRARGARRRRRRPRARRGARPLGAVALPERPVPRGAAPGLAPRAARRDVAACGRRCCSTQDGSARELLHGDLVALADGDEATPLVLDAVRRALVAALRSEDRVELVRELDRELLGLDRTPPFAPPFDTHLRKSRRPSVTAPSLPSMHGRGRGHRWRGSSASNGSGTRARPRAICSGAAGAPQGGGGHGRTSKEVMSERGRSLVCEPHSAAARQLRRQGASRITTT